MKTLKPTITIFSLSLLALVLTGCEPAIQEQTNLDEQKQDEQKQVEFIDEPESVTQSACIYKDGSCCRGEQGVCQIAQANCKEGKEPVIKGCDEKCEAIFECVANDQKNTQPITGTETNTEQLKKEQIKNEYITERQKYPSEGCASGNCSYNENGIVGTITVPEIIKSGKDTEKWETYEDIEIGYKIEYPGNWIIMRNQPTICGDDCKQVEDLMIQNLPYVGLPGTGPEEGSVFKITILEYSSPSPLTIQNWIMSSDIPEANKQKRIDRVKSMYIAEQDRDVSTGEIDVNWQKGITFVNGNKLYKLVYFSGNVEQFDKDLATFNKMVDTFKIISGL